MSSSGNFSNRSVPHFKKGERLSGHFNFEAKSRDPSFWEHGIAWEANTLPLSYASQSYVHFGPKSHLGQRQNNSIFADRRLSYISKDRSREVVEISAYLLPIA